MNGFDGRCPWWAHCSCTHTTCVRGWLPDQPGITVKGNESDAVARRCPVCHAASKHLPYVPPRDFAREAAGDNDWRLDRD